MLASLTRFSFRHRWMVLLIWLAALVGTTVAAGAFAGEYNGSSRLDGTDSQVFDDLVSSRFPPSESGPGSLAVFQAADGITAHRAQIDSFLADAATVGGVVEVGSPFTPDGGGQISADGTIAFAPIGFTPDYNGGHEADAAAKTIADLRDRADVLTAAGVRAEYSGGWFLEGGMPATEGIGLAFAALILLIAFGSVIAAGLPIITAVIGIGTALAGVGLWSAVVRTPDFTVQVASMIGIGVGIDYALFIVTRFREARSRGRDVEAAAVEAATTAGRAVVFAGITVMISLLGMMLMRLSFLNGLALGSSTAVLIAVLAAITLLPALLGLFGKRIKPMRARRRAGRGMWDRWGGMIQRHPVAGAAVGLAALVTLGLPTLALRLGTTDAGSDAADQTTRQAYDLLAEGFGPGFNGPLYLAVDQAAPGADAALPAVVAAVRAEPGVAFVAEPQLNPAGDAAIVELFPTTSPQSTETEDLLHRLRGDVLPAATAGSGATVAVGGLTASDVDFAEVIGERLPWFIGAVLVCSFLLLLVTFRSILVPLKAVVMNLLSIGAAYGVMVAVFQWGWFASLIGVGKSGPIAPWAPMMLFAIVFGLSMDYEVFLLSKVRERFDATGDNGRAVAEGLASTARVITAAAAIMVFVFGAFVFSELVALKLIGLGLATAVLIDATVVRLVLVPATMELLGDRNWWLPRWLDRLLPHFDIEGGHAHLTASAVPTTPRVASSSGIRPGRELPRPSVGAGSGPKNG